MWLARESGQNGARTSKWGGSHSTPRERGVYLYLMLIIHDRVEGEREGEMNNYTLYQEPEIIFVLYITLLLRHLNFKLNWHPC